MNNVLENSINDLTVKQIDSVMVPKSNKVDSRTFSRLLDDDKVVASYKMYWLFGILEEVTLGNTEIEFNRIVARMIVAAWYPIMQYKLSFGVFDNLQKPINYVALKYGFASNCNENDLLKFLCESEDKELKKMMRDLTCMVPYRLLSPFFKDKLKGQNKSSKNKMLELVQCVNKDLYAYVENEFFLAYLLFSKDKRVNSFFGVIQTNSKNVIPKIRAMAWDLFHLRNLESQVAYRNSNSKHMYMHYFCSRDEGINEILELNPIRRMIIQDERCYPLHEHNIFQTEFGDIILDSLREYERYRKDNIGKIKLFKVANRYEQSLINFLKK